MSAPLSNKAIAVLELLREEGELTCKRVGEILTERTPCGACDGTGEGDDTRWGCRKCHGRGQAYFDYSTAYQQLMRLKKLGLVQRRYLTDEWGDDTPTLVWRALDADPADPLEQAFRAPSAEVNR